jgi:hypothetical protein
MAVSLLRRVQLRELRPRAQETPDNTVLIEAGIYTKSDGSGVVRKSAAFNSSTFPAIVSGGNVRYDVLSLNDSGTAVRVAGTEVAGPGDPIANAPAFPIDKLVIAIVRITETGAVVIDGSDITDVREFLNKGASGAQGPQGWQGLMGIQGPQGIAGVQGNQGWQGGLGPQGNTGVQGNQGNQGTAGTIGVNGNQGNQGNQGIAGVQGNQGWQGNQGNQGNQGWQGVPNYKNSSETLTQASHGFAAKDVIRRDSGGSYIKAKSDTAANAEAVGVVESVNGNDFVVVYSGRISGLSGLTDGSVYRLSDVTAGLLTTDAVAVNSVDKPMLVATSTTTGIVVNYRANLVEYSGQLQSLGYYKPSITVAQTVVTTPWSYETGANRLWVWRNGFLQILTTDYAETNSTTITLVDAITESDEELIILRMPNGMVPLLRSVEANTAGSGSPNILTDQESSKVLTNEGATAKNYHTLPTATAGLTYSFYCQDIDGIRITAASGDTIRLYDQVSAAAGYCESTDIGSSLVLVAINTTEWVAIPAPLGVWSVV